MEIGKVPESVLKRSIFKQIHTKRPEVLVGAGAVSYTHLTLPTILRV